MLMTARAFHSSHTQLFRRFCYTNSLIVVAVTGACDMRFVTSCLLYRATKMYVPLTFSDKRFVNLLHLTSIILLKICNRILPI